MNVDIKTINFQQAQEEIRKELAKLHRGKFVTVGIHESANRPKDSPEMTMAELGALQNYGNEHIPARPWLEPGVASGNQEYADTVAEGIEAGLSPNQILEQIGNIAVGYTKQFVVDLKEPPNAPSTIAAKGSSNPLINTAAMVGSITHAVQSQTPEEGL